jgi:hypothetical protein
MEIPRAVPRAFLLLVIRCHAGREDIVKELTSTQQPALVGLPRGALPVLGWEGRPGPWADCASLFPRPAFATSWSRLGARPRTLKAASSGSIRRNTCASPCTLRRCRAIRRTTWTWTLRATCHYLPLDEFVATELPSWYGLTPAQIKRKAGARLEDGDGVQLWPFGTSDQVLVQNIDYSHAGNDAAGRSPQGETG